MITKAITNLRPNSSWMLVGDTLSGLTWMDKKQSRPTDKEILDEVARLQAEYEHNEYQRLRADEYPSIQDQLDMQYHDAINGTTTWQDAINAVKAKYPKP